jgi:alpha-galactosidase
MRRLAALVIAVLVTAVVPLSAPPPAQAWENGLARTPPMGWNQWNAFGCNVTDALVRATADRFVSAGLRDAGYTYVNIDDCWMTRNRDASGNLVPDPVKFPTGIRAVADYVHSVGLKLGIYSSAGTADLRRIPGQPQQRAAGREPVRVLGRGLPQVRQLQQPGCAGQTRYTRMRDAIIATGRPMVYSITEWGQNQPWTWAQPSATCGAPPVTSATRTTRCCRSTGPTSAWPSSPGRARGTTRTCWRSATAA